MLRMIATSVLLVQAESQSPSSRDSTMADWRRFNDHTVSQEWTLAGGVPNAHGLDVHRTISGLKEFEPIGFTSGLNPLGATAFAGDKVDTVSQRGSFIRRHLFAGAKNNWDWNAAPRAHPGQREHRTKSGQHVRVACQERTTSPPVPPIGRVVIEREHTSPLR